MMDMAKKGVKSLFGVVVVVLGVTFLSYILMHMTPSDPAEIVLKSEGFMPTAESIEQKRTEMGLDRPVIVQYFDWLRGFMRGDLGVSLNSGKDVTKEVLYYMKPTLMLSVLSFVSAVIVAFPVGVISAAKKERAFDRATQFLVFIRVSTPSFLVGLLLMYFFAFKIKLFPIVSSSGQGLAVVLPMLTLSTGVCARLIRQTRAVVAEELKKQYVAGARARGVPESRILFSHVLKNVMLPLITASAMAFGGLVGGAAVTEILFSWPGLGQLVLQAINQRDYTMVQGYVVYVSLIFCLIYGLCELSYSLFDPRVRQRRRHMSL